ncbi:MAG: hypothetical protein HY847_01320 [Betaproteobacteria bacterium]|nr:hypothetical protein [Betaproteobacteria bacterium]
MTEKVPVTNNTKMAIYVAGTMIPPGETRHFDSNQVPAEFRPAPQVEPEDETQFDPLAELIAHNVKEITAALPGLSDEDLERLGDMEQAKGENARKSLLNAIAEAQLTRADAKANGGAN